MNWLSLAGSKIVVFGVAKKKSVAWHVGARLEEAIRALRGGLMPGDTVQGPSVPSVEAFRQLKALGYIDEGPDPTIPSDPAESAIESPTVPH